jgi:transforming growth factor-beta-induced protein
MTSIKATGAAAFVAVLVGLAGCASDFTSPTSPAGTTITEVAVANDSLKAFVAALTKAGLAANFGNINGGQYTVFAPSNYAFVKYLRTSGFSIGAVTAASAGDSAVKVINNKITTSSSPTISSLATRLNYHIISASLPSSQIIGAQGFTTWNGARLSVSKVTGGTYTYVLNGNAGSNGANIIDADKTAANGVLHVIDAVMSPISSASLLSFLGMGIDYTKLTTDPAFITVPSGNTNYNVMANALKKTLVITTLIPNASPLPDNTLFVPDDANFVADLMTLYTSSGITNEASAITFINGLGTSTTPTLADFTDIVKYHAVSGRILSTDLLDGQMATTLSSNNVKINVSNGVYSLTDNSTATSDATVTSKNNLTNAGIVHVINHVLVNK